MTDPLTFGSVRVFLLQFFAAFLVIFSVYVATAVVVNPRGYFPPRLFPQPAQHSRPEKIALFLAYSRNVSIDGLVLGSSRSMLISPAELDGPLSAHFFNLLRRQRENGGLPGDIHVGAEQGESSISSGRR